MAKFTVLYDSLCPVCRREVQLLKRLDPKSQLHTLDMTQPEFDPQLFGLSMEQCIGSLRGVTNTGTIVEGMETVREMYRAVGLGWVIEWTKWPGVRTLADGAYWMFAKVRPRFSSFDGAAACEAQRCKLPTPLSPQAK